MEVELDLSLLLTQEVLGLADAPDKLVNMGRLGQQVISVVTLLEIGAEGQITLTNVGVTDPGAAAVSARAGGSQEKDEAGLESV